MKSYEEIQAMNSIDAMKELGIVYKGGRYELKTGEKFNDFDEAKRVALSSIYGGQETGALSSASIGSAVKFVVSTGGICEPYECIDVVVTSNRGTGSFDYIGAYKTLVDHAKRQGADGLIHIGFNERSAIGKTCFGGEETVYETRCWGTMIKLKE